MSAAIPPKWYLPPAQHLFLYRNPLAGGVNTYSLPLAGLAQGVYNVMVLGKDWRSDVITFSGTGN